MYSVALFAHSWLRWVVLLAGLLAVARAIAGRAGGKPWTAADDRGSLIFSIALDIQVLIGLLLYGTGISPIMRVAFLNMAESMRDPSLRFWAVEHLTGMVVALGLAHVGRAVIKRRKYPLGKHQAAAMFFGLAMVLILLSIPWPWGENIRPLFR